ncbi:MAG TPA: YdeI/OmpD-associated family protein [Gemmataceae bacterium]|nr:YdeI/OmpD-associated family protein [Gemmataceae bacterium]
MPKLNPKVDAYIDKSADFAKPILTHLRQIVHEACPDVEEAMKWSVPNFMYKGILCNMAAFKAHCAFGFWKSSLIVKNNGKAEKAMGQFGRITKLADLPSKKVLIGLIGEAVKLNDEGVPSPTRSKPRTNKEVVVPEYLTAALAKNRKARTTFEKFSPSHKREYVEWITDAKTEATRTKRLTTTLEWLEEGKPRNWKYMNC